MSGPIPVSSRAANIEYAIRDVVVPAVELESQGHEIIKLNIGDPIAYPGLPTPPTWSRPMPAHSRTVGMDIHPRTGSQRFVRPSPVMSNGRDGRPGRRRLRLPRCNRGLAIDFCRRPREGKVLAPGLTTHLHGLSSDVRCETVEYQLHSTMNGNLISAIFAQKWTTMFVFWCSSTPTIRAAPCAGRQNRCPAGHCTRLSQLHCCGGRDLRRTRFTGQHVSVAAEVRTFPSSR